MTGIPISRLMKSETKRLNSLETVLHKCVVGRDDAIQKVARAIRRSHVGIPTLAVNRFIPVYGTNRCPVRRNW